MGGNLMAAILVSQFLSHYGAPATMGLGTNAVHPNSYLRTAGAGANGNALVAGLGMAPNSGMLAFGAGSTVGAETARQVVIRYGIRAAMPVAEITAGTLGTVVVVSGTVGAVAGHGIDQIPTLWGGEKLSDYWGDAIAGALDLRPDYSRPPVTQTGGAMPPPRPPRVGNVAGGYEGDDRKNGETERTATGRERHKWYNFGEGFRPEVTLKNGDRVDAVNMQMRHIKELKPGQSR